jgi:putative radical SAM enzyme (TIGR03279 family)
MVRVRSVQRDGLGRELGLEPGFELLSINGRELRDFLDWEFLAAEDRFVLMARSPEGRLYEYDVERPEDLPLGVELEPPRVRRCGNRCDFCFVDGNPDGLREGLYIRDDDYRLSFRYGNFATLTNLKRNDLERIFEYKLSPLYVSVHATDPVVRRRLLRNPLAPDIVAQLRMLGAGGIQCHTQIVLQPGLNDGARLLQTLEDLFALGPVVLSVSVVPVGLTTFSKRNLVREPTTEECWQAVAAVELYADRALSQRGSHWVYGSDDLYLCAGMALPPAERYDDFDQVENGVGSVRFLQRKVRDLRADLKGRRIGVATGVAMSRSMPQVLSHVERMTGGQCELLVLENSLFGTSVTSAGLLSGRDFEKALATRGDLDLALIPAESLGDSGAFLDDVTLEQLSQSMPVAIRPSFHFADALESAGR